ncbi:MAG: phage tail protein [Chloroflexi bacterium]|nr:MAG: phage tail protein [Chloroflexota bacterium]
MSDSYIGEIRMFGGTFAPLDWAFCQGQLLDISQNDVLYSLIGTTYGGDGVTTFALPDLRGRVPMHQGNGYTIGQKAGMETVPMTGDQVAAHTHTVRASTSPGTQNSPANAVWAAPATARYSTNPPSLAMNSSLVSGGGGGQPHENMMPFLALNFIICLGGYYPTRD